MKESKVNLKLSDGTVISLKSDTIIFGFQADISEEEPYGKMGKHYTLGDHGHHHHSFVPFLMGFLKENDYFSIDNDGTYNNPIYTSSSVVSITHKDDGPYVKLFEKGL